MLAFWLARKRLLQEQAKRIQRCNEPWDQMTPTGAYIYNVRCCRRQGHRDDHESRFGIRWTR